MIIIGDFNARVRKESCRKTVAGGHSLHDENNGNGVRLINFSVCQQMKTGGILLQHKSIHEGTWRSPNEEIVIQTDHALTDQQRSTNLLHVRCFRGANAGTDSYISIAGLRGR
jgi:hypothetical protein